jgi:predicted nucleic acid-binding protein
LYLHEIEQGSKIFIDANIFVYHFSKDSRFNNSCTEFLFRVENSEIHGITSVAVVQEATHRLMMVEASAMLDIEVKNFPKYLKQHPDVIKQLTHHLLVPSKIFCFNIEIIQITPKVFEESQTIKAKYGFLTNDSLTLKIIEEVGITNLASNDLDFQRVDWLNLYLPLSAK